MLRTRGWEGLVSASRTHVRYRTKDNKVLANYSGDSSYWHDNREDISWDSTRRSGKLKRTRSCEHLKVSRTIPRYTSRYKDSLAGTSYFVTSDHYAPRVIIPGIPNLAAAHAEALEFFKAGCTSQEVDLITNLIELKQVTSTFDFLEKRIWNVWRAIKTGAAGHLTWSFAVKPLMLDVQSLAATLNTLSDRLAWLRKHQGRPVKVTFRKDVTDIARPSDSYVYWGLGQGEHLVDDVKATYTAYALVTYDIADLSDLELKARILARSFGVDNPLGVLWEMTPFSFVLDWIVRVGDFLASLTPKVQLPITFLDLGWTYKLLLTTHDRITYHWPYPTGSTPPTITRIRYFKRGVGIPAQFASLNLGDPGLSQLALAMSLFIQKVK